MTDVEGISLCHLSVFVVFIVATTSLFYIEAIKSLEWRPSLRPAFSQARRKG